MTHTRGNRPRKLPTQRRSELTYQQILEGAAQVFEKRGYARGTTNHIAERAGVSIGSLYQYFPNKDAILVELVSRHMCQMSARLGELVRQAMSRITGLEQTLQRIVGAILESHTIRPGLHRVLFDEAPHPPALRRQQQQVRQSQTAEVCRMLAASPEVRVPNAANAAYIAVALVEALTHQYVLYPPSGMTDESFVDEVVVLLRGYLSRAV